MVFKLFTDLDDGAAPPALLPALVRLAPVLVHDGDAAGQPPRRHLRRRRRGGSAAETTTRRLAGEKKKGNRSRNRCCNASCAGKTGKAIQYNRKNVSRAKALAFLFKHPCACVFEKLYPKKFILPPYFNV